MSLPKQKQFLIHSGVKDALITYLLTKPMGEIRAFVEYLETAQPVAHVLPPKKPEQSGHLKEFKPETDATVKEANGEK